MLNIERKVMTRITGLVILALAISAVLIFGFMGNIGTNKDSSKLSSGAALYTVVHFPQIRGCKLDPVNFSPNIPLNRNPGYSDYKEICKQAGDAQLNASTTTAPASSITTPVSQIISQGPRDLLSNGPNGPIDCVGNAFEGTGSSRIQVIAGSLCNSHGNPSNQGITLISSGDMKVIKLMVIPNSNGPTTVISFSTNGNTVNLTDPAGQTIIVQVVNSTNFTVTVNGQRLTNWYF